METEKIYSIQEIESIINKIKNGEIIIKKQDDVIVFIEVTKKYKTSIKKV